MKSISITSFIVLLGLFSCNNDADFVSSSIEPLDNTPSKSKESVELYKIIKEKDSLLFQIGFNRIDTAQVSLLTSNDFEFYHDEHGVTNSKGVFVNNIGGIKDLPFKTWRTLVKGSMEVFPLYTDNQELYGAIQNGKHDFYQQKKDEEARKTNTARFTHLWLIKDNSWKLTRVLSYDHQVPK